LWYLITFEKLVDYVHNISVYTVHSQIRWTINVWYVI